MGMRRFFAVYTDSKKAVMSIIEYGIHRCIHDEKKDKYVGGRKWNIKIRCLCQKQPFR